MTFSQLSIGQDFACGLTTENTLSCWGRYTDSKETNAPPEGSFTSVGSDSVSCAIADDTSISCWGNGIWGEVADAPTSKGWAQAAGGDDLSCGLSSDGSISCWGWGFCGSIDQAPAGSFSSIAVGANYACALNTEGGIECWGVGDGDCNEGEYSDNHEYDAATPPTWGSWTAVDVHANHSCALSAEGRIACWGNDDDGQSSPP